MFRGGVPLHDLLKCCSGLSVDRNPGGNEGAGRWCEQRKDHRRNRVDVLVNHGSLGCELAVDVLLIIAIRLNSHCDRQWVSLSVPAPRSRCDRPTAALTLGRDRGGALQLGCNLIRERYRHSQGRSVAIYTATTTSANISFSLAQVSPRCSVSRAYYRT